MSVNEVTGRKDHVGNGSLTGPYVYDFRIVDKTHLEVLVNGVAKLVDTDYTVAGVGASGGGSVTFTVAPASGAAITLLRKQPLAQASDYVPNEDLPAERIEKDLDKVWMALQQASETLGRTFRFAKKSLLKDKEWPDPSGTNQVLGFDGSNTPTLFGVTSGVITGVANPMSATGDVIVGGTAGAPTRVAKGVDGDRLMPTSAGTIEWVAEYLNVKAKGATGLGVADDAPAVQAAVDALPTSTPNPGGTIYMPRGIYKFNSPVVLPTGVTVRGDGHGPNLTLSQGVTLIDAGASANAFKTNGSTEVDAITICDLAIKNATAAAIRLDLARWCGVERVSVLGSGVPIGVYVTNTSYFARLIDLHINGLNGVGAAGVKIDGGSNEVEIRGGVIRQNTTNIVVDGTNGVRIFGVDAEGSSTQTGVDLAPTAAADAVVMGNRFETLGIGIRIGTNGKLGAFGNWYGVDTLIGIQDNSTAKTHAIVEPFIFNAATPGVLGFQIHDALSTGAKFGSTTIQNISGGNKITAGSGKLQLGTTGGNPIELLAMLEGIEQADPAAPAANRGRLYFKDNGAGKTQLVCKFATGAVQVIATEP